MKPLATNQRVLIWFCVCPDESSSNRQKLAHIAFTTAVVVSIFFCYIPSIEFFVKFVSIDLKDSLYALFQVSALSYAIYTVIFVYFSRQKFIAIFENLSKIYNECKAYFDREFSLKLKKIQNTKLIPFNRFEGELV